MPDTEPVIKLEKMLAPEKVLLFANNVEEAAEIVMVEPLLKVVPLIVPRVPVR